MSRSDPKYQNGIARPSIRPPSARASRPAFPGSRSTIGLMTNATDTSTPTISPTTTTATIGNHCMSGSFGR